MLSSGKEVIFKQYLDRLAMSKAMRAILVYYSFPDVS
jgi:hypothetical protein